MAVINASSDPAYLAWIAFRINVAWRIVDAIILDICHAERRPVVDARNTTDRAKTSRTSTLAGSEIRTALVTSSCLAIRI